MLSLIIKRLFLLIFVISSYFFTSCNKESIRGSGSIGSRTINLQTFTSVESNYDIKAVISYGTTQEVIAVGYDNLLNILDFKVENGVLKLKFNTNYNTIRNGNVVANIKIPVLSGASIHGSQHIDVNGFISGTAIHAKIHGSGSIHFSNSSYQSALLEVYGSGNIDAQNLQAKQAEVNIHGSGNVNISVSERLKVGIFGSGSTFYRGSPVLETTLNGSGRIIKR
jgi:hypothetical protein